MSVNFDQVREIAAAYESAVRTNAAFHARTLNEEAFAAILGASRCMAYPCDVPALVKMAVEDARDPVTE